MNKPPFEFDTYYANADGVPIVHIDTDKLGENEKGPVCRIYLNDGVIYENPPYPGKNLPLERSLDE